MSNVGAEIQDQIATRSSIYSPGQLGTSSLHCHPDSTTRSRSSPSESVIAEENAWLRGQVAELMRKVEVVDTQRRDVQHTLEQERSLFSPNSSETPTRPSIDNYPPPISWHTPCSPGGTPYSASEFSAHPCRPCREGNRQD